MDGLNLCAVAVLHKGLFQPTDIDYTGEQGQRAP